MFWKCEYKTLCELRIQRPEKAMETENCGLCGQVLANNSPLKCPAQPTGPNSVKNSLTCAWGTSLEQFPHHFWIL